MSEPQSDMPEPVDGLVADYLRQVERRVDAASLLQRIEADRRLKTSPSPGVVAIAGSGLRRLAGGSLVAAALAVAFFGGRYFDGSSAQAATLLRDVRTVHTQAIDRCYRVLHAAEPSRQSTSPPAPTEGTLWTRGDYFWSDTVVGSTRMKIGRDESGTLWLTPNPDKGIRFSPDKTVFPKEVETLCQIGSLTVPVLVDEVLTDFDLKTHGPVTEQGGRRSVIWARLKQGRSHPFLSAAMLEVDMERNLLVRLVLWTHNRIHPAGTVTYTLVDRAPPGADSYRLESHLNPEAVIEDHSFEPPQQTPSRAE